MIRLIYISSATNWPTESNLLKLLEQARSRNLRQHITGMLLYGNATYMQILEGEKKDVHEIYDAICKDPRNNGVVKLQEAEIKCREFPDWSMGFKNLESCAPNTVPGFIDISNGKLDKAIMLNNKSHAINLILNFAKKMPDNLSTPEKS